MVGPNGGGKTTLVKLVLGLLTPRRGEVRLFGQPPRRAAPCRLHAPAHPIRSPLSRQRDGHRADGPTGTSGAAGRYRLVRPGRPPRRAERAGRGRHGGLPPAAVQCALRRPAAAGADRPGVVLRAGPAAAGRADIEHRHSGRGPAVGAARGIEPPHGDCHGVARSGYRVRAGRARDLREPPRREPSDQRIDRRNDPRPLRRRGPHGPITTSCHTQGHAHD